MRWWKPDLGSTPLTQEASVVTAESQPGPTAGAAETVHRRRAVVASTVGTTIEWYDFFLYGTAAALVFPKVFFPGDSEFAGVLAAFGTQLMGFATFLIGLLPGHATLGVLAPVLLVVLRIVQGIGVGGEWGGSVLMSMEW